MQKATKQTIAVCNFIVNNKRISQGLEGWERRKYRPKEGWQQKVKGSSKSFLGNEEKKVKELKNIFETLKAFLIAQYIAPWIFSPHSTLQNLPSHFLFMYNNSS